MTPVEITVIGEVGDVTVPLALLVRAPGVVEVGVQVNPADLADVLAALVEPPVVRGGLRAAAAQAGPADVAPDGSAVPLRLQVELSGDADGVILASVRRLDRPLDVGPLALQDLPYVIEALAITDVPDGG